MNHHYIAGCAACLCLSLTIPAFASESSDLDKLRNEIEQLRNEYQNRLSNLEQRLQEAEKELETTQQQASEADNTARNAIAASRQNNQGSANAFNPAISVILDAQYRQFDRESTESIPGFALGEESGSGEEGFTLAESEINLSANVDDKFYGHVTTALASEDNETAIELEEAYFQTLALPAGLSLKAGRYFSDIGYLNRFHTHSDDFEDRPLPYRALLANQLGDDGLQLRWIAPTDLFIEIGTELFRGNSFPSGGADGEGIGTWTAFSKIGGDIGVSHSWQAGLSYLDADAEGRETGDDDLAGEFSGDSDLVIADFVYKWAPNGNPARQNVKLQGEAFWRDESGRFTPNGGNELAYSENQFGWYLQGIYQFRPNWRFGLRHARLDADDPGSEFDGTALDTQGHDPHHTSVMLDWSPSEYSRIRLQYNRDETQRQADDQIALQYIMSIGSHGGHQF